MKVLDLFCGAAGGWSLGLHWAGYTTVAACEVDPARRAAFSNNNPGVWMYDDVRTLTATRLLGDLGYLPDIVAGSPPCQDASTANHRGEGIDGERTGLFLEFLRIVGEVRPRWVVAENVPGIRTRGADRLLSALETLRYACWPLVVGALHAGAPHHRQRVWVLAFSDETRLLDARRRRSAGQTRAVQGDGEERQRVRADARELADAGNADEAGLAQREGIGGDAREELAAVERAVGARGMLWNGGPAGHLRVADGVSSGLARQCISAYGDAVVPQIAHVIGNAIRRTEQLMREAA